MNYQIAVYNADNYNSQAEALKDGAFYPQSSDWTYGNETGLQDLQEVCDAINKCHNGETRRDKAQFVLVIREGGDWVPLDRWAKLASMPQIEMFMALPNRSLQRAAPT